MHTAAKLEYQELKRRTKQLRADAMEQCPINEEVREKFESLPDTEDDVDAAISACRARINQMQSSDPRVVREYEERKVEIEGLQQSVARTSSALEVHSSRIEELRQRWEPLITSLAKRLDDKFGALMAQIGCSGEVVLATDHDDYAKYEMQIKVKFRENVRLQVLSAHVQSGGERSVATMLYLIALQDLTDW
jgi:chromosome segregation ATPase